MLSINKQLLVIVSTYSIAIRTMGGDGERRIFQVIRRLSDADIYRFEGGFTFNYLTLMYIFSGERRRSEQSKEWDAIAERAYALSMRLCVNRSIFTLATTPLCTPEIYYWPRRWIWNLPPPRIRKPPVGNSIGPDLTPISSWSSLLFLDQYDMPAFSLR